jgi:hypothetical protein
MLFHLKNKPPADVEACADLWFCPAQSLNNELAASNLYGD